MSTGNAELDAYIAMYKDIEPIAKGNNLSKYGEEAYDKLGTFSVRIKNALTAISPSGWDGSVQSELEKAINQISTYAREEQKSADHIINSSGPIGNVSTALAQYIDIAKAYIGYQHKVRSLQNQESSSSDGNTDSNSSSSTDSNSSSSTDSSNSNTKSPLELATEAMNKTETYAKNALEVLKSNIENLKAYFNYDFGKHEATNFNPNLQVTTVIPKEDEDLINPGLEAFKEIEPTLTAAAENQIVTTKDDEENSKKSDKETTTNLAAYDETGKKFGYEVNEKGEYVVTDENGKVIETLSKEDFEKKYHQEVKKVGNQEDLKDVKDGMLLDLSVAPDDPEKSPWKSEHSVTDKTTVAINAEEVNEALDSILSSIQSGDSDGLSNIVLRGDISVDLIEDGRVKDYIIAKDDKDIYLSLEKDRNGDYVFVAVDKSGKEMNSEWPTMKVSDINKDSENGITIDARESSDYQPAIGASSGSVHTGTNQTVAVCTESSKFEQTIKDDKIALVPKGTSLELSIKDHEGNNITISATDSDAIITKGFDGYYRRYDIETGSYSTLDDSCALGWDNETNEFIVDGPNG